MIGSGALRERLLEAWVEIRDNLVRSVLQCLGVAVGVASVLGGFAISDSMRTQAKHLFVQVGGLDKVNVAPSPRHREGAASALQAANLGLRQADAESGVALDLAAVPGGAKHLQARVRSPHLDQIRQVLGISGDFAAMEGYTLSQGRPFSVTEQERGEPVALLGAEAQERYFPSEGALGRILVVDGTPVTIVGVFQERVFRFQTDGPNLLAGTNRVIAVPAALVQKRLLGDPYQRLDRLSLRLPGLEAVPGFALALSSALLANHRLQRDFRLDDLAARVAKAEQQSRIYDAVFLLSGLLSLLGGGIVNVNIQMASLQERVREVGVKMAIGASSREVFKSFLTEALLISCLGTGAGLVLGFLFSWAITASLDLPLQLRPVSWVWSLLLAGCFAFAFALYPAWKASRMEPMEALHYE